MATTEPTTDTGQTPENNQKETTHMSKAQGQFTIIDYRIQNICGKGICISLPGTDAKSENTVQHMVYGLHNRRYPRCPSPDR